MSKEKLFYAVKECLDANEDPFDSFKLINIMEACEHVREAAGDDIFSSLLKNTANKRMIKAFETREQTWQKIVNKPFGSRPDFKLNTLIRLDDFSRLKKVVKRGPANRRSVGEESGTYKVETYEDSYDLNRTDIINDDLGELLKFPKKQGNAAFDTVDKFIWDFINNGTSATLSPVLDGTALFTSGHGNLLTTAPLSTVTLAKARYALANMKNNSEDGDTKLGLRMAYLIVPDSLTTLSERIITAQRGLAQTANNDGNPFSNLEIITVPWLTDTGVEATADWYLAASPNQTETIDIDFLKGKSTPQTLMKKSDTQGDNFDFESNSWAFKTRYEFGGRLVDYRWIIKNDAT